MALDPWSYAEKSGKEHAHQVALFMWANMAQRFGDAIASDPLSYSVPGHAKEALHAIHSGEGRDPAIPQLKWLHAIHNQGHGDKIRGAKAKAEGVKTGVADLFLPVPMLGPVKHNGAHPADRFAGLYIELKVGNNKPSADQIEFIDDMRAVGYAADWVIGWQAARQRILAYLQLPC